MPIVTATPRSNSNGEVVTEFLDTVNTIPTTYTFLNTQERLKVKNNGYGSFQLTVNGSVVTMLPSESKEFYGSIDSFVITSNGGVQSFEVVGTNYKDEEFKLTGSKERLFASVTATSSEQLLVIGFQTKEVMFINDGVDTMSVAFDGKSSKFVENYAMTDAAWSLTGAWTTYAFEGKDARYTGSSNTSNNAMFKPAIPGILGITLGVIKGLSAAIAKIELSMDNGATWLNPSDIAWVYRSDGATGSGMNTYDEYASVNAVYNNITYYLPYRTEFLWAMRITPTNTKNPSSGSGPQIFVADAQVNVGLILPVKPKEHISLEVQTTQIKYSSPTTTNARIIAL